MLTATGWLNLGDKCVWLTACDSLSTRYQHNSLYSKCRLVLNQKLMDQTHWQNQVFAHDIHGITLTTVSTAR